MGIADRHYARHDSPAGRGGLGGRAGFRTWSVTTWLIVICVGVYVIDGFLQPYQAVPMREGLFESQADFPPDRMARVIDDDDRGAIVRIPDEPLVVTAQDSRGRPRVGWRYLYVDAGDMYVAVGREEVQMMHPIEAAMHFSTRRGFLQVHFWRLIGFQFLHSHDIFMHLAFNMLGLYFFGPLVEQYLGSKRFLAFYLLCGICGALMYVLLNLLGVFAQLVLGIDTPIPGLLFNDISTPLIGASAGVFGVLMAGASLRPRDKVLLFFVFPIQFRFVAYALVAMSVYALLWSGDNAGGEAGHLGGAIAGFYFIRHPQHLHGFFDILGRVDPTSHHYRDRAGGARSRATARISGKPTKERVEIDRILDKIKAEGLHSLTAREKKVLEQASRERG